MQNQLKEVEDKKPGWSCYCKYTKTGRDEIGQCAANHGIANAVQKFKQKFPAIKQQSVSNFKHNCIELKGTDPSQDVTEIQAKKRGLPFLLVDQLMTKTGGIIKLLTLPILCISESFIEPELFLFEPELER